MPEETRVLLAHNYLAHFVRYVDKDRASNLERSYLQSAYGALVKHGCVCQGYAEAFKRLMDAAGVPCDVVTGSTDTVRDADHAWNIVKLHGGRDNYHIDVTWDAADPRRISYEYFGLSDSRISLGRNWNRRYNARCNSSTNLLITARTYISMHRATLIRRGIPAEVLG
jgi:transglutaminase/protease-like cytokinesis protein 3